MRKPKAVGVNDAHWYRGKARLFYEVEAENADQARKMIARGDVQPAYIDGQSTRVVAGPGSSAPLLLRDASRLGEEWARKVWTNSAVLVTRRRNKVRVFDFIPVSGHWYAVEYPFSITYSQDPALGGDFGNEGELWLAVDLDRYKNAPEPPPIPGRYGDVPRFWRRDFGRSHEVVDVIPWVRGW